jgi:hypothetical protein
MLENADDGPRSRTCRWAFVILTHIVHATEHLLIGLAYVGTMQTLEGQVRALRQQLQNTETQLRNLRLQLQQAEQQYEHSRQLEIAYAGGYPQDWQAETLAALSPEAHQASGRAKSTHGRWPLESEEYKRYGRQMILPEVGLHGQLRLRNAKVLLVGVGGLGCPAAAYLAGAGVGTIGLMDGDTVEISNLHRQVAHGTERVGMSKVDSAVEYLTSYVLVASSSHAFLSQGIPFRLTRMYTVSTPIQHTTATHIISHHRPQSRSSPNTTSYWTAPITLLHAT